MKSAQWTLALLPLLLNPAASKADVIAPAFLSNGGGSVSAEGLVSVEQSLTSHASLAFWAGGGYVSRLGSNPDFENSWGTEGAIELRLYSKFFSDPGEMKRFFSGIYCGLGYMHGPGSDHSVADHWTLVQSFGAKIGYKAIPVSCGSGSPAARLAVEPYGSVGFTFYSGTFSWNALWVNLGLRMVLEIPFRSGAQAR